MFEENPVKEMINIVMPSVIFEKLFFNTCFRPQEDEKTEFSNSSGSENIHEKLRLRDGLMWTLESKNIAVFSNFSGLV